jgi:hypothetical protein
MGKEVGLKRIPTHEELTFFNVLAEDKPMNKRQTRKANSDQSWMASMLKYLTLSTNHLLPELPITHPESDFFS